MSYFDPHTVSTGKKSARRLPPRMPELPFLAIGGPLSSHPPHAFAVPPTLRRSNAVRRVATESVQRSSIILAQADIEDVAVPALPEHNHRQLLQSPVRKFSLPTQHPKHPRTAARYYVSALSTNDHAALASGDKNHNFAQWTPEDVILSEESRKHLMPTNTYIGPDKQVCIIPMIIVTEGQDQRAHIRQLCQQYFGLRSSSASTILAPQLGSVAWDQARAYNRVAGSGSFVADTQHLASYRPSRYLTKFDRRYRGSRPRKDITFDKFLAPHHSGKGEVYRDS